MLEPLLEPLSYDFMQRALLAAVLMSVSCAAISTFVVLRGLSFMGAGVAHAALGGIGLAVFVGVSPLLGALLFALLLAFVAGYAGQKGSAKRMDVAIGVFFAFGMALGVLFISLLKEYAVQFWALIFGDILAVSDFDLTLMAALAVVVIAAVTLFFREFQAITFDFEAALASGINATFYHYFMLTLIALSVVVALKCVGVLLVFAMLTAPAAAAYELSKTLRGMLLLSIAFALVSSILGLLISFYVPFATSALIVIILSAIFFGSLAAASLRKH
ncbi:MAG: metal ABC transporter permease [Candidatus Alkanophagales archaeon]|nr:MAG: metal ABC transporter permease [Candidatus Alkanophagales archaeon]